MITQTKTFSYRLRPTQRQAIACARYAGCARFVYNYGLARIKSALENKQKVPKYKDLANMLPGLKKNSETAWLKEAHSQVLQQSLKDLESAQKHFFRRLKNKEKPGFPRFKKKGSRDSFRYPQGFQFASGKVFLPKIGWVRYRASRPMEGIAKQVTVKREADHWNMHVMCEVQKEVTKVAVTAEGALGIDVGLANFAYLSNGQAIENPRFLQHDLKKLKAHQGRLSRKKKGSNNRKKAAQHVAKLHMRVTNKRKDFHHKLSTNIAKNHGVVAVENLCVKGMIQNKRLSRAIADVGWRSFLNYLGYKCEWLGKHFVKVDKFLPSSKTCSACGSKQEMPLAVRIFKCASCNICLDRDFNASINIRAAGLSVLKACGEMSTGSLGEARIPGFQAG